MRDGIVIRSADVSDFPQWKILWDGYNAFYGRDGTTGLAEEITNQTWQRFFDMKEPMHCLVAERANQILGIVHFLYHRSTISITPTCYLQDLFTIEAARGQGVGRALIEEVYKVARAAHCNRVYWLTHETNETAMKLYDKVAEKSGFIVYRRPL